MTREGAAAAAPLRTIEALRERFVAPRPASAGRRRLWPKLEIEFFDIKIFDLKFFELRLSEKEGSCQSSDVFSQADDNFLYLVVFLKSKSDFAFHN